MSGYGNHKWTCGECGEAYEASGVVGDLKVDRWVRNHRKMHQETARKWGSAEEINVRPRGAGCNLSVDVVVNGYVSNVPLPPNQTGNLRVDCFYIGGKAFYITVNPDAAVILAEDIHQW